jgi:hypothetical protein
MCLFRSTNVRLSFQNSDLRNFKTSDRGVQAVPNLCPNCSSKCPLVALRSPGQDAFQESNPNKKARTMEMGVQTSPLEEVIASVELSNLLQVGCNTMLPDSLKSSLEMVGTSKWSKNLAVAPPKPDYAQVHNI